MDSLFIIDIIKIIYQFVDIKNLLDTTHDFDDIKIRVYLWKLNSIYSKKYILDNEFKTLLNNKIINKKQIYSLTLNNFYKIYLKNLQFYTFITELKLSYCSMTNLDILDKYNLHKLSLHFCNKITNFNVLHKLINLQELYINCGNNMITYDLSFLSRLTKLHTLDLYFLRNIININQIENLDKLRNLTLFKCDSYQIYNLLSVIKLSKLHTFELSYDFNDNSIINNILNNFVNLNVLKLSFCKFNYNSRKINIFGRLSRLELDTCDIRHIDILENNNIQYLTITNCNYLLKINISNNLINLKKLNLSECKGLKYINISNNLINLYELNLSFCEKLKNIDNFISKLPKLHTLNLCYCINLTNINILSNLTNLYTLNLSYCTNLININVLNNLTNLSELIIIDCYHLYCQYKDLTNIQVIKTIFNENEYDETVLHKLRIIGLV
jgi:hypothetical protein